MLHLSCELVPLHVVYRLVSLSPSLHPLPLHFLLSGCHECCVLQSALRLKPTFTDAYNNLASALVQKGMVPAALQCYQAALQINPHLVRPSLPSAMQRM